MWSSPIYFLDLDWFEPEHCHRVIRIQGASSSPSLERSPRSSSCNSEIEIGSPNERREGIWQLRHSTLLKFHSLLNGLCLSQTSHPSCCAFVSPDSRRGPAILHRELGIWCPPRSITERESAQANETVMCKGLGEETLTSAYNFASTCVCDVGRSFAASSEAGGRGYHPELPGMHMRYSVKSCLRCPIEVAVPGRWFWNAHAN